MRKLLLSAVVVLIEPGSPLQVTLAVLVCSWAHVLHAAYQPWGRGTVMYTLQHGSLFVTSFVFLMVRTMPCSSSISTRCRLRRDALRGWELQWVGSVCALAVVCL